MGRLSPRRALAAFALGGVLWLLWPWLRPRLWPATGSPWLVVLDGYHRLDHALDRQGQTGEPLLLITCPNTGQPTRSQLSQRAVRPTLQVILEGYDTATQAAALANWLSGRDQQGLPSPRQIMLVSDAHHFPRAAVAAQIAVGGRGSQVIPLVASRVSSPDPGLHWPVWRDALRLQLWRLSGSTGARFNAAKLEQKIEACFSR